MHITYEFQAKLWQHQSDGGWYFVSLPKDVSAEIRTHLQHFEEGWSRLKAKAEIDGHIWLTAIWVDTKRKTYLLPIKADIRRKLKFKIDDLLDAIIKL